MSEAKHTAGPWSCDEPHGRGDDKQVLITAAMVGAMRRCVAITCRRSRHDEQSRIEADARLIAAAPELLAALIQIRDAALDFRGELVIKKSVSGETFAKMFAADDAAQAAIAKAKGTA